MFPDTSHYMSDVELHVVHVVVGLTQAHTHEIIITCDALHYPFSGFQKVVWVVRILSFLRTVVHEDLTHVLVPMRELLLSRGLDGQLYIIVGYHLAWSSRVFWKVHVVCSRHQVHAGYKRAVVGVFIFGVDRIANLQVSSKS